MIETRSLTKRFGSLTAVDDLTLSIGPGEVFGFIGPNGAGKSTTMRILASLLKPDGGKATIGGLDVTKSGPEVRRLIGYMPDFLGVYDDLTVDEYLQFFAAAFSIPRKRRAALIDSVLELTDLTAKRHAMVSSLSRGMQQRLGVARVLIHEPKVLLLDEPASGLDPRARIEMRSLLQELARMGKCLMVSSHILTELAEMSTSIGIIERGRLLYAGSIADAYARVQGGERIAIRLEEPADPQSAATLLQSDARVVSATVENGHIMVELTPGSHGHHFLIELLTGRNGTGGGGGDHPPNRCLHTPARQTRRCLPQTHPRRTPVGMKLPLPNPAHLIFGPIFQKEVRTMGRRRGTYVARSLLAAGMLGVVAFAFAGAFTDHADGIRRLQSLQAIAPMLTLVVLWFQFIILALMAPMLTSGAIAEERQARTLPALFTTPLTASQIVFGKISSRLVQIIILVLLALPLLLALRIFGGVSAYIVLAATAVVLSTAILGAALGLLCSLYTRLAGNAAQQAIFLLALVQFGPYLAAGLRLYVLNRLQIPITSTPDLTPTAAWIVMTELSQSAYIGLETQNVSITIGNLSLPLGPIWAANALYNLAAALAVAMLTAMLLRRTMLRLANEDPAPVRPRFALLSLIPMRRGATRQSPDTSPPPEQTLIVRDRSRTVHDRPVLWRELRQQTLGSRRKLAIAIIAAVIGFALAYWYIGMVEEFHIPLAMFGGMALLSQAAYATAGSIAAEREGRTWDCLLATPLPGHQIILDKFLGALRSQWFIITVLTAHFLLAALSGSVIPAVVWQIVLIYLGPLIFLCASGQFFALAFRRNITAAALNLILAVGLYAGTWIVLVCIAMLFQRGEPAWFERLVDFNFAINPIAMAATSTNYGYHLNHARATYHLAVDSVTSDQFSAIVLVIFIIYCAAAAAILGLASRLFNRFTGRAS